MASLRIVTWNCNMALRQKLERLLSLRPDVAVIQECANLGRDTPGPGPLPWTGCDWIGTNEHKGLGVFTFGELQVKRHERYSQAFSLFLPLEISGRCCLNLLGVWVADRRSIPPGATNDPLSALRYYRPFLAAAPSLVAGDFNRLPQQMSRRDARQAGLSVTGWLAGAGLQNADTLMGQSPGHRSLQRTHYHRRRLSQGFVVDYIFVPASGSARLVHFEVGDGREWTRWSDHVPLVADLELAE